MLNDAELAKVRAQRHKMAEVMEREGISLFVPTTSDALEEFCTRIGSGGVFTEQELALIKESAKQSVKAWVADEKKQAPQSTTKQKANKHGSTSEECTASISKYASGIA